MKHFSALILFNIFFSATICLSNEIKNIKSCAVVLHGLARTSKSMNKISIILSKNDYIVWNETYPSKDKKIEDLSPIIDKAIQFCINKKSEKIFFVTHSMGGILVRHYFQNNNLKNRSADKKNVIKYVKAIVMISPPNHGSEIVDAFKSKSWFKWYNGPAGLQMGTDSDSLPNKLEDISIPIGIITGNVSSDPWFSYLFDSPNDGKVSVESAKLSEMKDFLVVPHGHTFIMNADEVIDQTLYFFENLKFKPKG
jgi:triacylglycerol lipase